MLPQDIKERLGLNVSKGMILYGEPGTGKTLIARKLCEILRGSFTTIKGSELLTSLVGQGAQNVIKLFQPAQEDWEKYGESSPLHFIIIDEIDALCPRRGTTTAVDGGASDQIVTQFLTNIDGINNVENICVVGTTNRFDSIDDALKRPGRLDQHYEIGSPDECGRLAIWKIHLKKLLDSNLITQEVINQLAVESNGFTGAQIKAIVDNTTIRKVMGTVNNAFELWQSLESIPDKVR